MGYIKLNGVLFSVLIAQLIIVIILFSSYLFIALGNNNILIPVQDAGMTAYNHSPIISNAFESVGDSYEDIGWDWIDNIVIGALLIFFTTSVVIAYRVKNIGYMNWVSLMFYGNMFLLYLLSIIEGFTNWFYDMMIAVLPMFSFHLPATNHYLNNIGIYSLLQVCILLLVNIVDLDLQALFNKKKKEQVVENEIL